MAVRLPEVKLGRSNSWWRCAGTALRPALCPSAKSSTSAALVKTMRRCEPPALPASQPKRWSDGSSRHCAAYHPARSLAKPAKSKVPKCALIDGHVASPL